MEWNRNVKDIPSNTEVLVLTNLGEVLIAWRNRKNSKRVDLKCPLNGKIEWFKNEMSLSAIVYWSRIDNLTKKQFNAVFEPNPRWNKMFEL